MDVEPDTLGELPIVEEPMDEELIAEEPIAEEPIEEEPIEEEPVDEGLAGTDPIDEAPATAFIAAPAVKTKHNATPSRIDAT